MISGSTCILPIQLRVIYLDFLHLEHDIWRCLEYGFSQISKLEFFVSYDTFSSACMFWLRNFSLVASYSLKFTRCSLLIVKSLVTFCKFLLLFVADVSRCKICLLLVGDVACCKKSLVTRCEIRLLLVAEVAHCKYSLVTSWKIRSLFVAKFDHCLLHKVTEYNIWAESPIDFRSQCVLMTQTRISTKSIVC